MAAMTTTSSKTTVSSTSMTSVTSMRTVDSCWRVPAVTTVAADAAVAGSYGTATHGTESFVAGPQHALRVPARRLVSKPGVATRIDGDPRSWSPPV